MTAFPSRVLSGRLLARNAVLNFAGSAAPMLAALVSIPLLVRGLGEERFGILSIAWVLIGYFGLFDLGLGRALTKLVAECLGGGREKEIPALTWTSLFLMFVLGVVGAGVMAAISPWLVYDALRIPTALQAETLASFYLLALSLPWVISTSGLRGVLEANQSFGLVNALRVPMGLLNFLGPLAVLPFSNRLTPIVVVLVAGRLIAWGAHLAICLRAFPALRAGIVLRRDRIAALTRYGGWITVSNLVSPLMNYMDRFLIGGLVSVAAVTYYVTPYELVSKLGLVPGAVMGVFFPAFATSFASDQGRTASLFDRGVRVIFLAVFPVVLLLVAFAHEGLSLWMGRAFADQSATVLQWLAIGIFVNCLAQAPFAAVQGVGRPDITGKLHLVELPLYAGLIWVLSRSYGIVGVAMAWSVRAALDAIFLFVAARRLVPAVGARRQPVGWMTLGALAAIALALTPEGLLARAGVVLTTLLLFAFVAWRWILDPLEREWLRDAVPPRRRTDLGLPGEA